MKFGRYVCLGTLCEILKSLHPPVNVFRFLITIFSSTIDQEPNTLYCTVLGRCFSQLRIHKKTRRKCGKENDIDPFLCGDQSRIPREQNKELTTT